jgi:hypothetical protein
VDRKQVEKVVRRDLPGVIRAMLKGLPFAPPRELEQQIYDSSFEAVVTCLLDGSIPLGPDGHLTAQLVESSGAVAFKLRDSAGNVTNLPNT